MNELTMILTQFRTLAASILLALGGCLATGCSDQKIEAMIRLAQQGNAKISIQTPTQASFTMKILGSEFSVGAGSHGTITIQANYERPNGVPGMGMTGPLVGCDFGTGECNNMTAENCIQIGGTVRPALCGTD